MIHHSVSEWDYIPIKQSEKEGLTRADANRLIAVARAAQLGGVDGSRVLTDHHSRLRAQQMVGVIAAEQCTLEILPKIEECGTDEEGRGRVRERLVHMLAVAYDVDIEAGETALLGTQKYTVLEFLIGVFCRRLNDALRHGMPRRYISQDDDLPALRGRLDVQRQFTVRAVAPHRLACSFDEFSPDIPLNRVMKASLIRLAQMSHVTENQRRLREFSSVYADITLIETRALKWDAIILDRTNHRWKALLGLARLLLSGDYQTTSHGRAFGFSLLFPMNDLFETYISRMLAKALWGTDLHVVAQDRRLFCLVDPGGKNRFQVRPDILVRRGAETVMVIDTKWKRVAALIDDPKQGVSQSDVYQIMAYARLYECSNVMLLYPHHSDLAREGVAGRYRMTRSDDELAIATVKITNKLILENLRNLCFPVV